MKSIKASLVIGLLLGFGMLLGAGGWFLDSAIESALVASFDSQLRSEAMTILSFTRQERNDVDIEFTDRYLREYDDEVATRFYQVTRIGGKVEDRSESLRKSEQLPENYGTTEEPNFYNFTLPNGAPGRAIAFTFVPRSEGRERRHHDPNLTLGLVVAANRRELNGTLASIRSSLLAVGILSSIGAFLVVGSMVGFALRPVRRFTTEIESINAGDLGNRFDQSALPAELAPIAGGLNNLLQRLDSSFQHEKQFSSDVAHELRTPIAELRSLSEVALKWPHADPAGNELFRDTLAIARQMDGIVSSLLAIRRSELGKESLNFTSIPLLELLNETWKPLEPRAALHQLTTSFQIPPEAQLETDRNLLGLILKNLLENAVDYTPRRGFIRLNFESGENRFILNFVNTTQDLTAEDVPHLFERFWRKEFSRTASEHSGLGLALCRAYAHTLGYRLTATLVNNDLAFTLTGPKIARKP